MADKTNVQKGGKEIQLVIFRLADEEYGLQISQVREIIRMQDITPMPKAPDFIKGVGKVDERIVILLDVDKVLSYEEAQEITKAAKKE